MSTQEMIFTIQLDDGSLAEARVWDAKSAEAMRKAVKSPKPLRVKAAAPADTAGHALANDTLAVSFMLEGDVEGHTMTLRLPSAQEAREFQKRLLIAGVLAASIVAGAAGANLAMQQQVQAVPQAGPAITVSAPTTQVRTNPVTPATIDAQLRDSSAITGTTTAPLSPAKDAKDSTASGESTATDSATDSSPSGPGSRTTYPQ